MYCTGGLSTDADSRENEWTTKLNINIKYIVWEKFEL